MQLSIDGKVIAKARATSKKASGRSIVAFFAFQDKMDKKIVSLTLNYIVFVSKSAKTCWFSAS
jgi:hypothetical protein